LNKKALRRGQRTRKDYLPIKMGTDKRPRGSVLVGGATPRLNAHADRPLLLLFKKPRRSGETLVDAGMASERAGPPTIRAAWRIR